MVNVFSPNTESELATVVALLEAHEIRCFVQNAGFGSLFPGPRIDLHNKRSIMVAEEDVETALELLKDFQPSETLVTEHSGAEHSIMEKLRRAVEVILFGWFLPGHRRKKRSGDSNDP